MNLLSQRYIDGQVSVDELVTEYFSQPYEQLPDPREAEILALLRFIQKVQCLNRCKFMREDMKIPRVWSDDEIAPLPHALDDLLKSLAKKLLYPEPISGLELLYLRRQTKEVAGLLYRPGASSEWAHIGRKPLNVPTHARDIGRFLAKVSSIYQNFDPKFHPQFPNCSSVAAGEASLGWRKDARTSLPLAEAALFERAQNANLQDVNLNTFWQSRILNALTVAPSQGQLEWLAVVADTLEGPVDHEEAANLEWYKAAIIASGSSNGLKSLLIDEIVMTEATIDRPNELFTQLNGFGQGEPSGFADVTYTARLRFAQMRDRHDTPAALRTATVARNIMDSIKRILLNTASDQKKGLTEAWIESEWDVPSILFPLPDIRTIIKILDDQFISQYVSDSLLRSLVVTHRELKAVCARARLLSRAEPERDITIKTAEDRADEVELFAVSMYLSRIGLYRNLKNLQFDSSGRMVGTNAADEQTPRRLWDIVFNVTVEAACTELPWVAISHSWAQSHPDAKRDEKYFTVVNGRANVIPWAMEEDLKNIRKAVLRTGNTLAWLDKVCLRHRGIDGFDSALRHLEWITDIPFLDVVYQNAQLILVYLNGAGRALECDTIFEEGSSWLYRVWTAQETPASREIRPCSGQDPIPIGFFTQCQALIKAWHRKKRHLGDCVAEQSICGRLRRRVQAIQTFRALPNDARMKDRVVAVQEMMLGREAANDADRTFSLLSVLGISRRPLYDQNYSLTKATRAVAESFPRELQDLLADRQNHIWFNSVFSSIATSSSTWLLQRLSPFDPKPCPASVFGHESFELRGILVRRERVEIQGNGEFDKIGGQSSVRRNKRGKVELRPPPPIHCACHQASKPLQPSHIIDYFEWHGDVACCSGTVWGISYTPLYVPAFQLASSMLLSEDGSSCMLMTRNEGKNEAVTVGELIALKTSPEWQIRSADCKVEALTTWWMEPDFEWAKFEEFLDEGGLYTVRTDSGESGSESMDISESDSG